MVEQVSAQNYKDRKTNAMLRIWGMNGNIFFILCPFGFERMKQAEFTKKAF